MTNKILGFKTNPTYQFLSNFYTLEDCYCEIDNIIYEVRSAEHLYVMLKTLDTNQRFRCSVIKTPHEVKRYGRTTTLRDDFEATKLAVMHDVLRVKFSLPTLQDQLIRTGDSEIYEVNTWKDLYWGCNTDLKGLNHLGRLLMELREDLQAGIDLRGFKGQFVRVI